MRIACTSAAAFSDSLSSYNDVLSNFRSLIRARAHISRTHARTPARTHMHARTHRRCRAPDIQRKKMEDDSISEELTRAEAVVEGVRLLILRRVLDSPRSYHSHCNHRSHNITTCSYYVRNFLFFLTF